MAQRGVVPVVAGGVEFFAEVEQSGPTAARSLLERAVAIDESLAALDPQNPIYREDLDIDRRKLDALDDD